MSTSLLQRRDPAAAPVIFRADFKPEVHDLSLLAANGNKAAISQADRVDLLQRLRAGEAIFVELTAVTYIQRPEPNRNYVRFAPNALGALAKSFVGMPVLRNHDQWDTMSRGGQIIESKLVKLEDGVSEIHMTMRLVKAWAVESALDGSMSFFSIGWSRTGPIHCSVHGKPVQECSDWPGDKVSTKKGEVRAEWVFTSAVGVEVSDVNVPAVIGTGVESVRQLSGLSGVSPLDAHSLWSMLALETPGDSTEIKETTMDPKKLAEILGLGPDATYDQIMAAATAAANASDQLAVATAQLATERAELATVRVAAQKAQDDANERHIVSQLAKLKAAGKLKPGSEQEAALRRMATRDLALFDGQVADMLALGAPVTAAGDRQSEAGGNVAPEIQTVDEVLAADPGLAASLRAGGVTKAEFEQNGLQLYLSRKRAGVAGV